MHTPWRIQMLGRLSAQRGDRLVTRFASSRTAALLARLAFFPERAHPREELIGLLWPDDGLEAGRPRLRVALASLRRQLEPPDVIPGSVLVADRSVLCLHPDACRCDVAEFEAALQAAAHAPSAEGKREALDRAIALYAGELLPGFYDDWIVAERERLESLYEDACERRRALPSAPETGAADGAQDTEAATASEGAALPDLRGFPIQFTRFFGREEVSAQVAAWLRTPQARLVTLTGPGGAGKTRLAVHAAQAAADGFEGPVCFVPLADVAEARLIPDAVLGALGLPRAATGGPLAQAAAALAALPPALLVLDNFEHLVERGAPLVSALLTRVPALTCLVTSRRRLALPGERECPVPPLPLPDADGTAAAVARAASAQLFVDRAQAARPDFQLTAGNAAAVVALCRRLEGIPLAIELVAARAMTLTPAQMTERLAQRFALLTSRRGDKGTRHRSLWAALEWSHDLLPPDLGRFFARLSVFRGGTAEAAASVCEQPQALEFLTQLRERSLLVMEDVGEGMGEERRFRLLETLREFGTELLPPEERQNLSRRHADYFQGLAAGMDALWNGPEKSRALTTLDAEYDNLRAALAFCRADPPEEGWNGGETGMRLAASLGSYWTTRGLMHEGLGWLEGARRGTGSDAARAGALAQSGWLHAGMGEYVRAAATLTEAVALSRSLGDRTGLASALRMRGVSALWNDDYLPATADLEEALAVSRETGDEVVTAAVLNNLGVLAEQQGGDQVRARALYQEALALFLKRGDRQRASYCLHNLGNIASDFGDNDEAEVLLRESMALAEALGDLWQRAYCLRSLGDVALMRGELAEAVQLLEEGRVLCRRLGDRMTEAGTTLSLSNVRRRQGDLAHGEALARAALVLYQGMAHAAGRAESWMRLAEIAAAQSHWERTAWSLSAAATCRTNPPVGEEHDRFQGLREAAQSALGLKAFAAAWEQGRTVSCDEQGVRAE